MNNTGQKDQIDWYTVPTSMFPNGESDVADAIVNERAWAAVVSAYIFFLFGARSPLTVSTQSTQAPLRD